MNNNIYEVDPARELEDTYGATSQSMTVPSPIKKPDGKTVDELVAEEHTKKGGKRRSKSKSKKYRKSNAKHDVNKYVSTCGVPSPCGCAGGKK